MIWFINFLLIAAIAVMVIGAAICFAWVILSWIFNVILELLFGDGW